MTRDTEKTQIGAAQATRSNRLTWSAGLLVCAWIVGCTSEGIPDAPSDDDAAASQGEPSDTDDEPEDGQEDEQEDDNDQDDNDQDDDDQDDNDQDDDAEPNPAQGAAGYYGILAQGFGNPTQLVAFDSFPEETGFTEIGEPLPGFVNAIEFSPDGSTLYGSDNSASQLVRIDVDTGATEVVGAWSVGGLSVSSMTHADDGQLYATGSVGQSAYHLFRVEAATASVTDLGELDFISVEYAPNGTLYGSSLDGLFTVDSETLATSRVGTWDWELHPDDSGYVYYLTSLERGHDGLLRGFGSGVLAGNRRVYAFDPAQPDRAPTFEGEVLIDGSFLDLAYRPSTAED